MYKDDSFVFGEEAERSWDEWAVTSDGLQLLSLIETSNCNEMFINDLFCVAYRLGAKDAFGFRDEHGGCAIAAI